MVSILPLVLLNGIVTTSVIKGGCTAGYFPDFPQSKAGILGKLTYKEMGATSGTAPNGKQWTKDAYIAPKFVVAPYVLDLINGNILLKV